MKSAEIRRRFLEFFARHGHEVVPSSSLVPGHDPSLLFTNAGMVQFKDVFLGQDSRPYNRAASSQRCVRAGGKHNDLENVGYTARHHTFFEMLGNFSFGDYFKREAIRFAWDFLTGEMGIPAAKLWITVHADDNEAADIWLQEMKVDPERFTRIATSDNFWQMGDTGPCGPCSEIFYDHGPEVFGGPPGSPDADGDRYVEIWNLVFMQFNRDAEGIMHPLPKPSVDTGMGLERISAVLQGVHSNYGIDLFQELIQAAARVTGATDLASNSLKVIADHIRACSFLIVDGVYPGNDGRDYVLRRIIRRAIRHGYKLGCTKPFFHLLVEDLAGVMGEAYPDLVAKKDEIAATLKGEEERFAETLEHGMALLERAMTSEDRMLSGQTVFQLYDTFGFPLDLTADIARERGFTVDFGGFEAAMEEQRARARAASRFSSQSLVSFDGEATRFAGYENLDGEATVVACFVSGEAVPALEAGQSGVVILDETPFYAESGGQVGDIGRILGDEGIGQVTDTQKVRADVTGHQVTVEKGRIAVGDPVTASVAPLARAASAYHHSVTHLLHAALRQVLGTHVAQKGSLVTPERTRFDFSHREAVKPEELAAIEDLVNRAVRANDDVDTRHMAHEEAIRAGAMALFGEKYGDVVRVVRMGEFSTELCGGTHVHRTGDIGFFKIVGESGVAAGVRRVEAVAGEAALKYVREQEGQLGHVAAALKTQPQEVEAKLAQVLDQVKHLEKELARFKSKLASSQGDDLADSARIIGGAKVVVANLEGVDAKALRETMDKLKDKLKSCAVVLATVAEGKVFLVAGVTPDLTGKVKAGELVNVVATRVGGKGGGRPEMAQAGGTDPSGLPAGLEAANAWLEERLA